MFTRLEDVIQIKKIVVIVRKMELVNSENNNLLKNNILSILICKIQLLFQCKSL